MRRVPFYLSIWLFFTACAPVTSHYLVVEQHLASHDARSADAAIEKQEKDYRKEDRLLYQLDRGMTLSLSGQFERSNQLLDRATQTAEALYTESITRHGAALLTNDYLLPYSGEDYERVMIHMISALNYAQMGQLDEALVECRRVNTALNKIHDQQFETDRGYQEDAFARYLSGALFEAAGEVNDAFLSYRKAYETYQVWVGTYGMPIPPMIGADLLRTSAALHLDEEHKAYKKLFPHTQWTPLKDKKSHGEILLVSLHGKSPRKEDAFLDLIINQNLWLSIIQTDVWRAHGATGNLPFAPIGQLVRVAFPQYVPDKTSVRHLEVTISGSKTPAGKSTLMSDLTAIAVRDLSDRINRIRIKAFARAALKALIVKGATDKAEAQYGRLGGLLIGTVAEAAAATTEVSDKRSWRTLPDEIHLTRIALPAGTYQLSPMFVGQSGVVIDTLPAQNITIGNGETKVLVVRTVR